MLLHAWTGGISRDRPDRVQPWWWRHTELDKQVLDSVPQFACLLDPRLAAVVLNNLDSVELRDEVAPGVAAADLGDALEEQREDRDRDVRLDPPRSPVEDRPHAQATLELVPALLHAQELLVAERQILDSEGVVVGGDHPLAVVARGLGDGSAVDAELATGRLSQVAAVATTGEQRADPLGVSAIGAGLHRRDLGLELCNKLAPVRLLARGLVGVVADHVASTPLSVADDDFLDSQVVAHLVVAPLTRQHVLGDLVASAHLGAEDVLAVAECELASVVLRGHAGIADEDTAPEPPAAEILLDLLDGAHVGRVAGEHPGSHWQPIAGHGESDDDLRGVIPSVLRVAALAQRLVPSAVLDLLRFVLVVDLEVQRGGVVEDEVHVAVHQVGGLEVDSLLDLGLVFLEEVHGAVEVLQLERSTARQVHLFTQPLLPTVQLRVRGERAVGDHREQRPLERLLGAGVLGAALEHRGDVELLPQLLEDVDSAVRPAV